MLYVSSHPLAFGSGSKFGSDWLIAVVVIDAIESSTAILRSFIGLFLKLARPMLLRRSKLPDASLVQPNSRFKIVHSVHNYLSAFNDGHVVDCIVLRLLDRNNS